MSSEDQFSEKRVRTHHHRSGSSGLWSQRSKLLLAGLIGSWLVIFFVVLFLGIQIISLQQENELLVHEFTDTKAELEQLKPLIKQLREDRRALVEGRFPRLIAMQFDQVINLDQSYVRNVLFNQMHDSIEYKLIVRNDTYYRIWPEVTVKFFNDVGRQIHSIEIGGPDKEATNGESSSLAEGEGRSYTGAIGYSDEDMPAYFTVDAVQDENPQEEIREVLTQ